MSDVSSDPGMAGPSLSRDMQHCQQRQPLIPPPRNAFMQFAQEKRRSLAAEKVNEANQPMCWLWRSLSVAAKKSYHRKAAEVAAVHRRRYPDYVHRGARQRKMHEHEQEGHLWRKALQLNFRGRFAGSRHLGVAGAICRHFHCRCSTNGVQTVLRTVEHRALEVKHRSLRR
ncbi:transcription factor SOX-3-like [Rhipicephalus sanguineus]|uniref:transcription factor SOX-3-like n=1 Tax=Rhipicephalus sanguineus TaxID=34632 RepID=UPI001892FCE2|nr:transcription factor SOX-3-like [Rhipicephalus sanguineus]